MPQFPDRIRRVSRRDDPTSPVTAPCHSRSIDAVLAEECEDIAFLPVPVGAETGAELLSRLFETRIRIITSCDGALINHYDIVSE